MIETKTSEHRPLSGREKVLYGFGDLSTALIWNVTTTWAMFFFTDIFKISALAAGTMLLIARIYDAAIDPFIGFMVDRTSTRMGRARPYLLWFAIPYGLVGSFLFFTPDLDNTGKLIYAYILYFLLVTVYSLINTPYNALITLMTKDQKERTQLSRNRLLFAMSAYILVSLIPVFAEKLGSGSTELEIQRTGFFRVAIILGICAAAGFLITFFNTRERYQYDTDKDTENKPKLKQQLLALLNNRPWVVTVLMTLVTNLRTAIMTAMVAYYSKYFLNKPDGFSSILLVATIGGMIAGLVLGPMLIEKKGVKKAIVLASFVSLAASVLLFPAGKNTVMIIACMVVFGVAQGVPSVATYPMYGDAVEYGEWKTGVRVDGVIFSSYTLMQQVVSGLAGFLIGTLLTFFGYNSDLTVQNALTVNGIAGIFILSPIILSVLTIIIVSFYPLDRKKYEEIIRELEERRITERKA